MRQPLPGVSVRLDGTVAPSSTTIAAAGGSVLVLASALPEHGLSLTSCYLASSDGALAVSRLRLTPAVEDLEQHRLLPGQPHATLAGACLFDHAVAVRDLVAATTGVVVAVDIALETLERAAEAWGPPPPPG